MRMDLPAGIHPTLRYIQLTAHGLHTLQGSYESNVAQNYKLA